MLVIESAPSAVVVEFAGIPWGLLRNSGEFRYRNLRKRDRFWPSFGPMEKLTGSAAPRFDAGPSHAKWNDGWLIVEIKQDAEANQIQAPILKRPLVPGRGRRKPDVAPKLTNKANAD